MTRARCSVALLRGVNVGGKNKLRMADLVEVFESVGCEEVRTYIQSGNVVFRASATMRKRVAGLVSAALADHLGLQVPIVVCTDTEFRTARSDNPFFESNSDLSSLHVGFLQKRPSPSQVAELDSQRSPGDEFRVLGSRVFFFCPNGLARTKLTTAYFDRRLATVMTARNWKTVNRLIEMIEE